MSGSLTSSGASGYEEEVEGQRNQAWVTYFQNVCGRIEHNSTLDAGKTDWKLNQNVECSVRLERMSEEEYQRRKAVDGMDQDPLPTETPSIEDDIDIKYELSSAERISEDGVSNVDLQIDFDGGLTRTNPNPEIHESIQKEFQELYRDLRHCDQDCGTCLVHIRKLSEHVRATHVGGQEREIPSPLLIDPVDMDQSSAVELKYDPGEDVRREGMKSCGDSEYNSDSDPDFTVESESDPDDGTKSSGPALRTRRKTCERDFLNFPAGKKDNQDMGGSLREGVDATNDVSNTPSTSQQSQRNSSQKSTDTRTTDNNCRGREVDSTVRPTRTHSVKKNLEGDGSGSDHDHKGNQKSLGQTMPTTLTKESGSKPVKLYKCNECGKCSTTPRALGQHKLLHSHPLEKRFTCEECKKSFTRRHHLIEHKNIHTGEAKYNCDVCGKSVTKRYLTQHKRLHTGDKPHKCDWDGCAKRYTQLYYLTNHKKTHTGERPYECDVCQKNFPTQGKLNGHKKIHTGVKPFKCTVCQQSFTMNGNLTAHQKSLHTVYTLQFIVE